MIIFWSISSKILSEFFWSNRLLKFQTRARSRRVNHPFQPIETALNTPIPFKSISFRLLTWRACNAGPKGTRQVIGSDWPSDRAFDGLVERTMEFQ